MCTLTALDQHDGRFPTHRGIIRNRVAAAPRIVEHFLDVSTQCLVHEQVDYSGES